MTTSRRGGQARIREPRRLVYGLASGGLAALYPVLSEPWRDAGVTAVVVGAAVCVYLGRRSVRPDRRRPWTLLLTGLAMFAVAAPIPSNGIGSSVGGMLDALGNALLLAAALALVLRRGANDPGGLVDAAVIALAAGGLLWAVLPHRLGTDSGFAAQLNLFVVAFALTGVLGTLLRLLRTSSQPAQALRTLLVAISMALAGNIVLALAGPDPRGRTVAVMLFMGAFTATGLFGLDPNGQQLMRLQQPPPTDRLSAGRLVFLCVAVAAIPLALAAREIVDGNPAGVLLGVQGILVASLVMLRIGLLATERARAAEALEHQATHDPLTHLPNRPELIARLEREMDRGRSCALLFCDLDNFKEVNDRLGHTAGDRLLIEAAGRLKSCVRPPHMVSRFGGDEFVILLVGVTPQEAWAARDRVEDAFRQPFESAGATLGISIGIARTEQRADPEELLRLADRAMYEVKAERGAAVGRRHRR